MLHLAHKVEGVAVNGTDGQIGTLEDFYFHEDPWAVRYLLVNAGGRFDGTRLLIPPRAVSGEWGVDGVSVSLARAEAWNASEHALEQSRLRSVNRSTGYHLQATNGEIGHVDDFLIREETFEIPYVLVDTSNWIGGRSVIVSSDLLRRVAENEQRLYVEASRDTIRQAPALESIEAALPVLETGPPFTII